MKYEIELINKTKKKIVEADDFKIDDRGNLVFFDENKRKSLLVQRGNYVYVQRIG